jgi:hypothetical protein
MSPPLLPPPVVVVEVAAGAGGGGGGGAPGAGGGVDKSEMTHKNPELRTAGVVPTSCECSTCSPLLHISTCCRQAPSWPASSASHSAWGAFAERRTKLPRRESEMTHKNPELRTAGVVPTSCECSTCSPLLHMDVAAQRVAEPHPGVSGDIHVKQRGTSRALTRSRDDARRSAASSSAPQKPPKPSAMQKKPAKKELDGNKWNVVESVNGLVDLGIVDDDVAVTVKVFLLSFPISQRGPPLRKSPPSRVRCRRSRPRRSLTATSGMSCVIPSRALTRSRDDARRSQLGVLVRHLALVDVAQPFGLPRLLRLRRRQPEAEAVAATCRPSLRSSTRARAWPRRVAEPHPGVSGDIHVKQRGTSRALTRSRDDALLRLRRRQPEAEAVAATCRPSLRSSTRARA